MSVSLIIVYLITSDLENGWLLNHNTLHATCSSGESSVNQHNENLARQNKKEFGSFKQEEPNIKI